MVGRERVEREFQLARQIQETFLPQSIPMIEGWEIGHPAGARLVK
jgi:serine phosphatase RsbU (regulator of sigma subunit)